MISLRRRRWGGWVINYYTLLRIKYSKVFFFYFEYTKNHWSVCSKGMNCITCELYFNKPDKPSYQKNHSNFKLEALILTFCNITQFFCVSHGAQDALLSDQDIVADWVNPLVSYTSWLNQQGMSNTQSGTVVQDFDLMENRPLSWDRWEGEVR